MRRLVAAGAAAGCVAAGCVAAGPAGAYEVGRGVTAVPRVDEQAQACFDVYAVDHVYAVASAHGLVRAASPADPAQALLAGPRGAPPTHVVNEPSAIAWGSEFRVCAGGVGTRALSGRVVYTLHAHGPQVDHALVLVCTFSFEAPPACV